MNLLLMILTISGVVGGLSCIILTSIFKKDKKYNNIITIFYCFSLACIIISGILCLVDLLIKIFN